MRSVDTGPSSSSYVVAEEPGEGVRREDSKLSEMPTFATRPQPKATQGGGMRRNESAAAQLQEFAVERPQRPSGDQAAGGSMRPNRSYTALSELRRREQASSSGPSANGNRQVVMDAVVLQLHELMLAAAAQAEAATATAAAAAAAAAPAAGSSAPAAAAAAAAAPPEVGASVRDAMHTYIDTIVRQLELPNSCIVAMLIYVQRAVADTRFTLTVRNWQPCLLAAFVVAAKLSFDEPVWNEDFVKALRISNVQTSQISRWEADFLQLIKFNTNVDLNQYTTLCFSLQQSYERAHGTRIQFFTYLMMQAKDLDRIAQAEHEGSSPPQGGEKHRQPNGEVIRRG